ncbi:tetratricopeptide repeat protein, partial [Chloroflexota bacterium]
MENESRERTYRACGEPVKPMPLDFRPRRWALLLVALGICALLLMGCMNVLTTSKRPAMEEGTSTPAPSLTPILTATPSPSATPTQTAISSPTATSTPIPSPTPTPPVIVSPTLSPTPLATPVPSQTPSPTPAPQLSARLVDALRHQANGDYEEAIAAYLAVLEHDPTPEEARQARFSLAESYLLSGEYASAASAWESFLAGYPDDPQAPQAALMAARAYRAVDLCELAIPLLQSYVHPETVLADMAYEWIGDCHLGDLSDEEALAAYRVALDVSRVPDVEAGLREKVAAIHVAREEYSTALAEYDTILRLAGIEECQARIEYLAGPALAAMDRRADANTRYRRSVESCPESEFAYLSLLELVKA